MNEQLYTYTCIWTDMKSDGKRKLLLLSRQTMPRQNSIQRAASRRPDEQRLHAEKRRLEVKLRALCTAAAEESDPNAFRLLRSSFLIISRLANIKSEQIGLLVQERKLREELAVVKKKQRRAAARMKKEKEAMVGEKKEPEYADDWGFDTKYNYA